MSLKQLRGRQTEERIKSHLENILEIRLVLQLLFDPEAHPLSSPDPRLFYSTGEIKAEFQKVINGEIDYKLPEKTARQNLDLLVEAGILEKYYKKGCGQGVIDTATVYALNKKEIDKAGVNVHRLIALSALKVFVEAGISPSRIQSKVGGRFKDDQKPISKMKILLSLYNQATIHAAGHDYETGLASDGFGPLERKVDDIAGITGLQWKTVEWNVRMMMRDGLLNTTYKQQRFKIVRDVKKYFWDLSNKQLGPINSRLKAAAERGEFCRKGLEFSAREICDKFYGGKSYDNVRRALERMEKAGVIKAMNHLTRNTPITMTDAGQTVAEEFLIPFYRFASGIQENEGIATFRCHAAFFEQNRYHLPRYIVSMVKSYLANTNSVNRK